MNSGYSYNESSSEQKSVVFQGKFSKGPWFLEILFINLKVLSKLKEGQKLYVKNDVLSIEDQDRPVVVKSLIRWWKAESRDETLKKIQEIIKKAIDCGRKAIESNNLSSDSSDPKNLTRSELNRRVVIRDWEEVRDKELHMGNEVLLKSLVDQLYGVTQGIVELEKTYKEDMTLCSKLELELELIERASRELVDYLESKK